jgi:Reverse transcriptase (RNA-dependent DNA polymerase)
MLIGNDILTLDDVKSSLQKVFSMKNLDETAYILGIKIYRDRSRKLIGLSQGTYIDKVLKMLNMQDSKKHSSSINAELETIKKILYASAIESIMYVMIFTLSNMSYVLSMTSRYQTNLGIIH